MPGDGIQPDPDPGAGPLSRCSSSLACSAGLSLGLRLLLSQLILYSFGLSLNLCASGHFQRGWPHLFSSCLAFMLSYMQSVLCVCCVCVRIVGSHRFVLLWHAFNYAWPRGEDHTTRSCSTWARRPQACCMPHRVVGHQATGE